ncbi:hydroxyethylthiazole kinase, partial [Microbacterium maritypicum]
MLGVLREAPPLTHCITNAVVSGFTANVLLALGAAPAMVDIV